MGEDRGGKICWLASYPKSGNTWVRALLTNYRIDGARPANINTLDGTVAAARSLFEEWVGIKASAFDAVRADNPLPEVYRGAAPAEDGVMFLKTHDMFRRTADAIWLFPAEASAGAVYVVRNVLDVAVSLASHAGVDAATAVERICDPGYAIAESLVAMDPQVRQVLGSWSGHVSSWLGQTAIPVHLVRYEDLVREPAVALSGIVWFCGLPYDEARVRKAVEFSGFEELRGQEDAAGFRERPEHASARFFREGRSGDGSRALGAELTQRLWDVHEDVRRRLGYARENEIEEEFR